jgi:hypothetical protein
MTKRKGKKREHERTIARLQLGAKLLRKNAPVKWSWANVYKNGARITVAIEKPPKSWAKVEPADVIRLTMLNKEYLGKKAAADVIMRPDEAHEIINLLNKALQKLSSGWKP